MVNKAVEYAKWCIKEDNNKVGKYVKLQCEDWLNIVNGEDIEAYFDYEEYEFVCDILKIMIHPDTRKSMYESLENYQWLFIIAVLCTKHREKQVKFYQTGLLEIARKNYKTFTIAIIFIIELILNGEFMRLFSVAPNYKLSCELKKAVDKIIMVSPALKSRFKINNDIVIFKLNNNEFTPLAYSAEALDGKLANTFVIDEAGLLEDYPLEAMRSSQITIKDKLGLVISTQYPNENNVFVTEIDMAKRILEGIFDDRRYFSLLYEPDEGIRDNWKTDNNVIYQSNPVTVDNKEVFEEIVKKRMIAIEYESKRENYLCKHNNIAYKGKGTDGYVSSEEIKRCKVDHIDWQGKEVYLGLDLASTDDNTSVGMVAYDEEREKVIAKSWAFIPSAKVDEKSKKEKISYKKFINKENCFACGEESISYMYVVDFIKEIEKEYGVTVVGIGYDIRDSNYAQEALKNDFDMIEVRQHSSVLHAPIKWLKELILDKNFEYEDNDLLEINFTNCVQTEDTNLNKYLNKKKSIGKIDMVMALVDALCLLQKEVLELESDWAVQ